MTRNILITGGTGFVGSWMRLTQPDDYYGKVFYLDRQDYEDTLWEEIEWEYIVHLAHVPPNRIIKNITENGYKTKVLLASSGAVYGNTSYVEYAKEKIEAENALVASGVNCCIARLFTFIGKYLKNQYAVTKFLEAAKNKQSLEVWGDGTSIRSYLYGKDLGDDLWTLLFDGDRDKADAYDVGSGIPVTVMELARKVSKLTGSKIKMVHPDHVENNYFPDTYNIRNIGCKETIGLDKALEIILNSKLLS